MNQEARPPGERLILLTLALVNFVHIVDFMIMMPLGPQLTRTFSISPTEFSYLVSIYTFSAGVFGFLTSFIVDRFDRKYFLIAVFIGFMCGTLACAFAPNYISLLLARLLTGAFGGVLSSLVFTSVADLVPLKRRGEAMGVISAGFSLASVLGVPLGLFFANSLGWHAPFLMLVLASLAILFLLKTNLPSMKRNVDHSSQGANPFGVLERVWKNRAEQWALGLSISLMLSHFAIVPMISPSMVSNVGFTEAQLTYIYLLGGVTTAFTGPFLGRLSDRIGIYKVFAWGSALAMVPIFLITHLKVTPVPIALMVTTSFFIVAGGRMIPGVTMASAVVTPEHRGSFMSLNSSVQQLALGLASLLAGALVETGANGEILHYERVGYVSIACTVITILMAARVRGFVKF